MRCIGFPIWSEKWHSYFPASPKVTGKSFNAEPGENSRRLWNFCSLIILLLSILIVAVLCKSEEIHFHWKLLPLVNLLQYISMSFPTNRNFTSSSPVDSAIRYVTTIQTQLLLLNGRSEKIAGFYNTSCFGFPFFCANVFSFLTRNSVLMFTSRFFFTVTNFWKVLDYSENGTSLFGFW